MQSTLKKSDAEVFSEAAEETSWITGYVDSEKTLNLFIHRKAEETYTEYKRRVDAH